MGARLCCLFESGRLLLGREAEGDVGEVFVGRADRDTILLVVMRGGATQAVLLRLNADEDEEEG